ncbi:MAG: pitrilysin family protein [Crocinitomicaceae bacterium]
MTDYHKFTLSNGLRVIFQKDITSPMAVVNTLYDIGARDENENKTGFAHLFEHLMFGGSVNIPDFDGPLQRAGGENNAFTSNDITNYYDVLPVQNIETALWLESDRMLSLAFTPKSLEVQRSVVIEEFKQRYLNQPYGDVWLELRPLAYTTHPYKWATIGKEISHIENATMDDVKAFFKANYKPSNAILSIAGNLEQSQVEDMVQKWYGDIPNLPKNVRNLSKEPIQTEYREKIIERDIPSDAFYYAFKMGNRLSTEYYVADLMSDILGGGKSSILYQTILKEQELVSEINAYILGSLDEGLFIISGKLNDSVNFKQLDEALWKELEKVSSTILSDTVLTKVKNKWETAKVFSEIGLLHRAMDLCYYENLGDASMILNERNNYLKITTDEIQQFSKKTFVKEQCSVLYIQSQKK